MNSKNPKSESSQAVSQQLEKNNIAIQKLKTELDSLDKKIRDGEKRLQEAKALMSQYEDLTNRIVKLNEKMKASTNVPQNIKSHFDGLVRQAEGVEREMALKGIRSIEDYNKLMKVTKDHRQMFAKYNEMVVNLEKQNEYYSSAALQSIATLPTIAKEPAEILDIPIQNAIKPMSQIQAPLSPSSVGAIQGHIFSEDDQAKTKKQKPIAADKQINMSMPMPPIKPLIPSLSPTAQELKETKIEQQVLHDETLEKKTAIDFKSLLMRLKKEFHTSISNFKQLNDAMADTERKFKNLVMRQSIANELQDNLRIVEAHLIRYENNREKIRKLNERFLDVKGKLKDPSEQTYYNQLKANLDRQIKVDAETLYANNITNINDFDEKDSFNRRELKEIEEGMEILNQKLKLLKEIEVELKKQKSKG